MGRIAYIPANAARDRARRAAAALARDCRVRLVYLFGSATATSRTKVRDVDLAILTDRPLGLYEELDLRADAAREAGGDIDLVSLNGASVVLAHEVAQTGICLHAASQGTAAEFVAGARMRYLDFKPYLDEQWKLVAPEQGPGKEPVIAQASRAKHLPPACFGLLRQVLLIKS